VYVHGGLVMSDTQCYIHTDHRNCDEIYFATATTLDSASA